MVNYNNRINIDYSSDIDYNTDTEYEEDNIEEPYYNGDKYLYQGYWYHRNFPVMWALTHAIDSGPKDCMNCRDYGCVNGVFIGYCVNCAEYLYDGERCRGFIDNGIEIDEYEYDSAFDTYLKGINIAEIKPFCNINNTDSDDSDDEYYKDIIQD
jgi:hypothetical protein